MISYVVKRNFYAKNATSNFNFKDVRVTERILEIIEILKHYSDSPFVFIGNFGVEFPCRDNTNNVDEINIKIDLNRLARSICIPVEYVRKQLRSIGSFKEDEGGPAELRLKLGRDTEEPVKKLFSEYNGRKRFRLVPLKLNPSLCNFDNQDQGEPHFVHITGWLDVGDSVQSVKERVPIPWRANENPKSQPV